jgi:hypothetical protein
MPLHVIGAGLGRTGTLSLKLALEKLGFGRCYHMVELLNQPERLCYWTQLQATRSTDFEGLFEGYGATVDFPGCSFWRELVAAYPEAKVVLTVREPERWYESAHATIFQAKPPVTKMASQAPFESLLRKRLGVFAFTEALVWQRQFEDRFADKQFALNKYEQHNREVIEAIPPERLLVFEVAQGWDPLCRFFRVEAPSEIFPRVNEREAFARGLQEDLDQPIAIPEG